MAKEPNKPANLPTEAYWYEAKSRWEMGKKKGDRPSGEWICWRKDGSLWILQTYNDSGVFEGFYKRYHPDGTLAQEGSYADGKFDGWIKYYRATKNNPSNEPFPKDIYNYNIVRAELLHAKGKKLASRYYLSNGDQVDIYARAMPKKVAPSAWWNDKDYEWEIGQFNADGQPIGDWIWWRYAGTLVCEASYDNVGQLQGSLKRYHDDGTLSSEGPMVNNKAHGDHYYYRSENYSQETPMNKFPTGVWKHYVRFENGHVLEDKYFTKEGTRCSSKGFQLVNAVVEDLFNGLPDQFLQNNYATFLERMSEGKMQPSSDAALAKRAELFRRFWGIALPDKLGLLFDLWERANLPKSFSGFEAALPKFGLLETWANEGKNLMETAATEAQKWYPYDFLTDWLTGTICLDSLRQNADKSKYYHSSYHYGLYAKNAGDKTGLIYVHQHNSYSTWGTYFNQVMARDVSSFLFALSTLSSFEEYDLLPRDKFLNLYDSKIKNAIAPPYGFINNMQVGNRRLYESDFNLRESNNPSIQFFDRARWIVEMLRAESTTSQVFHDNYSSQRYAPDKQAHHSLLQTLPNSLPEAFYHLWSAFWVKGFDGQVLSYISVCKTSESEIIRDIALLVEKLLNGQNQLGYIRDIQGKKDEFNNFK